MHSVSFAQEERIEVYHYLEDGSCQAMFEDLFGRWPGSRILRRPVRRQERCCCLIAPKVRGSSRSREYSSTSCVTTVNPIMSSMLRKCRPWCHQERNNHVADGAS